MTLPAEIKSIRALVEVLENPKKGRIVEAVRRYAAHMPPDSYRYAELEYKPIRFGPAAWSHLYVQSLLGGEIMLLDYRLGTAWLYRGPYSVESDIFGPKWLTVEDRLLFVYPVFSPKTLDAVS